MKEIIVFTDGSCIGNGKKVTFGGYGIYFPHGEYPNISESFTLRPVTNQRTESYAILRALQLLIDEGHDKIILYTDSEYSIKSITKWASGWEKNGWNTTKGPVKNLDLIKPLHQLYQQNKDKISIIHVRSHTGKEDFIYLGNAEADRLAVMGSKKSFVIKPKTNKIKSNSSKKISINIPSPNISSSSSELKPVKVLIKRHRYNDTKTKKHVNHRIKVTFPQLDSDSEE